MKEFKVSPSTYPIEKEKANRETIWEHYFARKIAFVLIPLFLKTRISANGTSIIALITAIVGATLIASGDFWITLLGALLMQLWLIMDKVDGVIARYTKTVTSFGKFLEELQGAIVASVFFTSIGIAASRSSGFLSHFSTLPHYLFLILGISTSFFVIFRHLISIYFDVIFSKEKRILNELAAGSERLTPFYKIVVKFSGVYSLAQPILILAVLFRFLDIYTVFYFICQALLMLSSVIVMTYRAGKYDRSKH